ncbi:NAD(P)H-quinone oxidoreductase [Hyphomicrobium sulfonivorans]|uniref:NAD(P)H-quinone oxidoreductase n=1 Tax=Hyphomicrobium sulfonivorans TaxID=121290 RepID=UPI00156EC0A5|nr:NAD(P)H-quinone oxidoreductase [Hyphomicrobium sulfonivorans]MBI1649716.1 NAD(P)H-quinone oxidoreductase [Hyphomicrobium sulfonivorans]
MTVPQSMTAIAIVGKGGPEVLQPATVPVPVPEGSDVLIKVAAAGVNRPDVMQRLGLYPAPKGHSEIPGLEVAGEIVALGPDAHRFKVGDRVMALVNGGGYAEYCLADAGSCIPVPDGISMFEAAALPEGFFTVWHNVFERGGLEPGNWFLVHGGTSGIGTAAIQLATAFGAKVIATAGSQEKCAVCRELGAVHAVDYKTEDFAEVVKAETGGRGVNVILDMIGGDYVERNIRSLADDGRLVNIAFQGGSKVTIDMMRIMLKRLTVTGSTLRIRPADVKAGIARQVEEKAVPLVVDGRVKVIIDHTFPLADAAAAHARMDEAHIGKIVLTV